MITITSVSARNFVSVGNCTQAVNLNAAGLTLVLGENIDLGGNSNRNGVGKTSLLSAISFALYGESLAKIRKDNLVNKTNGKGMLVTIDFKKGQNRYRIERGRKPNVLRWIVNDTQMNKPLGAEDDAEGDSRETQKEIEKVLGLSLTMFKHIVALNTFTEPFLSMGNKDQAAMIEEMFGITLIREKAKILSEYNRETKDGIKEEEFRLKGVQDANARINLAIENAKIKEVDWNIIHEKRIQVLQQQHDAMDKIHFDEEIKAFDSLEAWNANYTAVQGRFTEASRSLKDIGNKIKTLNAEAESYRVEAEHALDVSNQIRLQENSILRVTQDIDRKIARISQLKEELKKKEQEVDSPESHSCTTCGQGLSGTEHLKSVLDSLTNQIFDLKTRITNETNAILEMTSDIEHTKEQITAIKQNAKIKALAAISRAEAKETELESLETELVDAQQTTKDSRNDVESLGPKPETLFKTLNELYTAKEASEKCVRDLQEELIKVNPVIDQIKSLEATLQKESYNKLNMLAKLKDHQEFLLKLLTSNESFIRRKIIDQNLNYLNRRLNHYLEKLNLPHEVIFKNDLTVEITHLGRDLDFDNLSRGERNRLILGLSWAFRDVWESLNFPLSLMFIDELIDSGLDSAGVEESISILKAMSRNSGRNIFLISHRDEISTRCDNVLTISKENGFTRFGDQSTIDEIQLEIDDDLDDLAEEFGA